MKLNCLQITRKLLKPRDIRVSLLCYKKMLRKLLMTPRRMVARVMMTSHLSSHDTLEEVCNNWHIVVPKDRWTTGSTSVLIIKRKTSDMLEVSLLLKHRPHTLPRLTSSDASTSCSTEFCWSWTRGFLRHLSRVVTRCWFSQNRLDICNKINDQG